MAIPPFPSQDLAKLVLGYLAEEQLMTAYDEFLQASPYLDAFRNEYDRIFMTSLKNILAEYRAVKIYVETCKPFFLRKKIFQCSNLLEVVKFLVSYIDINRLHAQETSTDRISSSKQNLYVRNNICDVCHSLNLETCVCKPRSQKAVPTIQPTSHIESSSLDSSIETTALSDLPGNSVTKKISKDLTTETFSQTSSTDQVADTNFKSRITCTASNEANLLPTTSQANSTLSYNTQDILSKLDESKQKIEEFNNIYNLVCSNNSSLPPKSTCSSQDTINRTICNAGTFKEFKTGVSTGSDKEILIVPDSSTSESFSTQLNERNEQKININHIKSIKGSHKNQYLLKVGTTKSNIQSNNHDISNTPKNEFIKIVPKQNLEDHKITILSDVKVDNLKMNNNLRVPPQQPTTSTPLVQMQTIVINGTPAYKHNQLSGTNFSYTKDELMAMPTIILVPATGASKRTTESLTKDSIAQDVNKITTTTRSLNTLVTPLPKLLGPLSIDVSSNHLVPTQNYQPETKIISDDLPKVSDVNLVQTVDITHSSVPKDTNLTTSNKTSTPQVLPLLRKSSSTPRRSSHVRVLDFTTPRRILHETINEQDTNKVSEIVNSEETSDSPTQDPVISNDKITKIQKSKCNVSNPTILNTSTKENAIKVKKKNWDAELRALAVKNEEIQLMPQPKSVKSKVKKPSDVKICCTANKDKGANLENKINITPKLKKSKKKVKSADIETVIEESPIEKTTERVVKPTVNIITELDWNHIETKENTEQKVDQEKVDYNDERLDTPETLERLSLENVVGAKLNMSDFFETPYKQALYDIQMETPKFCGPDIPGEPISDIKIMNIPTPLFLNTPKLFQATPSSYSSRQTDYSSGGSYYKPDDQDYIPTAKILECAVSVVEESTKIVDEKPVVSKTDTKDKSNKSSRPQRKCTKNVSYKSPHVAAKFREDKNGDAASVSSETSNTSSREKKTKKPLEQKSRLKSKSKTDNKKKSIPHKSPLKKETPKKCIKIKAFKKTPHKDSPNKGKKKTPNVLYTLSSKSLSRKRTTSKENSTHSAPVVNSAPTKSRRKSSTPRKLHCTKSFNSDCNEQNSSDLSSGKKSEDSTIVYCPQDSDTEHLPLRWSDDGTQDDKIKESESPTNDDEISKIKKFIETSAPEKIISVKSNEGSLHIDLVRRGFDAETAKIIERDLLDEAPTQSTSYSNINEIEVKQNVSDNIGSDGNISNSLQIVENEFEEEEVELSLYNCNEEAKNFITYEFDESKFVPRNDISKFKDKFCMEVCIEDGVSIRLRATSFISLFESDDHPHIIDYNRKETEAAVSSISNIETLYTPRKDLRTQCYEIFDSTLTSLDLDTPQKVETKKYDMTVTEIVLEVENITSRDKPDTKKRKRLQSGNSDESFNKKTKADTQYLLNSTNIQNIDIESVLSKLHGP